MCAYFFLLHSCENILNLAAIAVNWQPKWIQNSMMGAFGISPNTTFQIGIYRDQSLIPIDPSGAPIDYSQSGQTIADFRVANATAVPIAVVGTTPWDSFDTNIDLSQRDSSTALRQPGFGFPFDLVSLLIPEGSRLEC
jgi:hypothetical protein